MALAVPQCGHAALIAVCQLHIAAVVQPSRHKAVGIKKGLAHTGDGQLVLRDEGNMLTPVFGGTAHIDVPVPPGYHNGTQAVLRNLQPAQRTVDPASISQTPVEIPVCGACGENRLYSIPALKARSCGWGYLFCQSYLIAGSCRPQ